MYSEVPPNIMTSLLSINMDELSTCNICEEILEIANQMTECSPGTYPEPRDLGYVSDVLDMACPHSDSIRRLWQSRPTDRMESLAAWKVECVGSTLGFWFFDETDPEQNNAFFRTFDIVAQPEKVNHCGVSTVIHGWIDHSLPSSWYDDCLKAHGLKCEEPFAMVIHDESTPSPDWLIDVKAWCIVPFNSDTSRYLTLSYTWGNVDCLKNTETIFEQLRKPNSLRAHSAKIPETVLDAIRITEFLGEQYLWVDSLCIIQDNKSSLQKNLNIMHIIYARSSLCLIAYAGRDANHGLKGIEGRSSRRDVDQIVLDIAGGEQLSWYNYPRAKEDQYGVTREPGEVGSTYNERGWTFQEFVFAKRRLLFTDGPLRWVCSSRKWAEDKVTEQDKENMIDIPNTVWREQRLPVITSTLIQAASTFNERHLRYPEDTLRAFLGVQNHLNRSFLGGLNYGHPDMFFDISLLWRPDTDMTRRTTRGVHADYMPSWSWMGWQGAFSFEDDNEYQSGGYHVNGFLEPATQWFAMESPLMPISRRRLIKCEWHRYKLLARKNSTFVPESWNRMPPRGRRSRERKKVYEIGGVKFRYPVPIPAAAAPMESIEQLQYIYARPSRAFFLTQRMTYDLYITKAHCVELHSTCGGISGFLHAHHQSDIDWLIGQQKVELIAVVKGWSLEFYNLRTSERINWKGGRQPCYFVLCIEWDNGIAKRRAVGKVLKRKWEQAQEPEPVHLILG